jgi:hypothetical protein
VRVTLSSACRSDGDGDDGARPNDALPRHGDDGRSPRGPHGDDGPGNAPGDDARDAARHGDDVAWNDAWNGAAGYDGGNGAGHDG